MRKRYLVLFILIFVFGLRPAYGEVPGVIFGTVHDAVTSVPIDGAVVSAAGSQGLVYVVDEDNHRIQKFDSVGNFITKWGGFGSGDGQFSSPSGISVDSQGLVYVVDEDNHRIQKFDSDGNFISKWGSEGSGGDGQFSSPSGISVDSQGLVYVVDEGNHRIQKFDSDGNFISKWGSEGSGDGQFHEPFGISVDSQEVSVVTDVDGSSLLEASAGTYMVTSTKSGYVQTIISGVAVGAGDVTILDIPMAPLLSPTVTILTINLSAQKILFGDTVDISGKLTPLADSGQSMEGLDITIDVTSPSGVAGSPYTAITNEFGQYKLTDIADFNEEGAWSLQARFDGVQNLFISSVSAVKSLLVGVSSCTSFTISPTNNTFVSSGGTGSVSVTAPDGCSWSATSNASWITITSGSSGSGNGTVSYSVSVNTSTSTRTGSVTIAGNTSIVTQTGVASTSPTPDIKANGSDNTVTIGTGDTLSITVSLSAGDSSGANADWWVAVDTPFGWFHFDLSLSWIPGLSVTNQGPLFDLSTFEVLNMPLPPGTYTFYFGVESIMNGLLDLDQIFLDNVIVDVVEN